MKTNKKEVIRNAKLPSNVLLKHNFILPYFIPYTAAVVSQRETIDIDMMAISLLKKTIIINETITSNVALIKLFCSYGRIVLLISFKIGKSILRFIYNLYMSIAIIHINKSVINNSIDSGHNK